MIHFEKRYTGVPFDAFITNTHYITDFNNKEVRAVITVAAWSYGMNPISYRQSLGLMPMCAPSQFVAVAFLVKWPLGEASSPCWCGT